MYDLHLGRNSKVPFERFQNSLRVRKIGEILTKYQTVPEVITKLVENK